MAAVLAIFSLFLVLLVLPDPSFSHPLCTDSRAPVTLNTTLSFCTPYNGSSCCNSAQDSQLAKQFQAMNVSNPGCASLLKSLLCSRCDPFSGELFLANPVPRTVPVLCNSTGSANFCSKLWDTCQNVSISNSPFAPSLAGEAGVPSTSNFTKLTDLWQSKSDFCSAFGGESAQGSACFNGEPVKLNDTGSSTPPPPNGLCLEKIGNDSYLNMAAHPDGSNRAFFANQPGQIWLATIPDQGSKGILGIDEASPFIDLTDVVNYDTEFGMMGIAFHPNFAQNGRLFASFNCDKVKWPGCNGRCSCNSDVNCDPSKLPPDNGAQPCQYQTVVAEYSANGSSTTPSMATSAKPVEVRRIFTMGLPFRSHHGGQILFGPQDGYLYFMMGDGGGTGDPYNFAQDKKSLLGKIMRLDVDNFPSAEEITNNSRWGNYSIPGDNPYKEDDDMQPEIWAMGLRNPWRCSFDTARPSYFLCADVGQDHYEEVDLITKGGNYGWRVFEGNNAYKPPASPGGNTLPSSINPIYPIMGYNHSTVNKNEGSASITGGYFYRSQTDPCMYGKYLYADLYASSMWTGMETPESSGNFTASTIPFSCAKDSPIPCTSVPGSDFPSLGYIFSFGQDNRNDVYLLASSGVYRVVPPSRCNYVCSKENATAASGTPGSASSPRSSSTTHLQTGFNIRVLLLLSSFLLLLASII
ncbi:HIPL1 protein [Linum grandiflorum]